MPEMSEEDIIREIYAEEMWEAELDEENRLYDQEALEDQENPPLSHDDRGEGN